MEGEWKGRRERGMEEKREGRRNMHYEHVCTMYIIPYGMNMYIHYTYTCK